MPSDNLVVLTLSALMNSGIRGFVWFFVSCFLALIGGGIVGVLFGIKHEGIAAFLILGTWAALFFGPFVHGVSAGRAIMTQTGDANTAAVARMTEQHGIPGELIALTAQPGLVLGFDGKNCALVVGDKIVPARTILSASLVEDGRALLDTSEATAIGGAVAGGLLFGSAGAVAGAVTGAASKGVVERLDLVIEVDDLTTLRVAVPMCVGPVRRETDVYRAARSAAENIVAKVRVLMHRAMTTPAA